MISIAAIGTSSITRRTIAASEPVAGLSFEAVYSRDAAKGAAMASELGLADSFDDFDRLLGSDVDAVYVASPNAVHEGQVRAALLAGKHVFVEKPAVQSASVWDGLCVVAASRNVALLENMRTAYDPVMRRVRELVPTLGEIRHVAFHFSQYSSRYDKLLAGERPAVFDPALGGGALNDLGVYVFHPLVRLFGLPDRVDASAVWLPTGADGAGSALLTYPGMVAEGTWSKITAGLIPCTIEGEDGTLTIDHITELHHLHAEYRDGTVVDERPGDKQIDNITYSLRRFAEVCAAPAGAIHDQSWTRDSLTVMDQVRASMAERRP